MRNKLLRRRMLCLMFFVFTFLNGFSAESPERKVRVGYGALPGYHEQSATGRRSGYGYEYLRRLSAKTGWNCEYIGYDKGWGELLRMLERGEIDLLSCVSKSAERELKFAFSANPIELSFVNITVKAGNRRFRPDNVASWTGIRVGMVRNNHINEEFGVWAKAQGISYAPVLFDSDRKLWEALQAGRIDASVSVNFRRLNNEWLLMQILPEPVFFAVRKEDRALLAELDRAYAELKYENPFLHTKLTRRYYSDEFLNPADTPPRRIVPAPERGARVFRALLNPARFPLTQLKNGNWSGIQYHIAQKILSRTGLDIRLLPCSTAEEYRKLRASGRFDILLDAKYDRGEAEEEGLFLCNPYFSTPVSILTRKNAPRRAGKTALLAGDDLSGLPLLKGRNPSEILSFSSLEEVAAAIGSGAADNAYLHTRACNELIREDTSGVLTSTPAPGMRMEYAMAVKREVLKELFPILSRATDSLSEEEIEDRVANDEFQPRLGFSIVRRVTTHPFEAVVILLFALVCVTSVFGYVLMARRKLYRNAKILERLPLRFFVADRNREVLLFNAPDLPGGKVRKRISELDVPTITRIMEETVDAAFRDGTCRIDYNYGAEKRSAVASLLPASIFGRETVVWISQDTTALQNARAEAVEWANRMRLNIQSIGDAVMITDAAGRITMINPVAEKLCGVTQADALGRMHEEIFHIVNYENDAPVKSPVREVIASGKNVVLSNHTDLISLDGSRRHIADSASPIPGAAGGVAGVILVFRDVTAEYDKRDRLNRAMTLLEIGAELTDGAAFEYDFHADTLTGSQQLDRLWPRNGNRPIDRRKWIFHEDLPAFNKAFRSLRKGEIKVAEFDFRSMHQGNLRFYRLKGCLDRSDSRAPKIVGVVHDITVQSALQRMELARSRAFEVFFSSPDIRTAFVSTLKILSEYTGSVFCCVLKRRNGETLDMELFSECRASRMPPVWGEHETIAFDPAWHGQQLLLRREGIVHIPDLDGSSPLTDCPVVKRLRREFGIKAVFLVGIYQGEELWGELGVSFDAPQRQYDPSHEKFLLSFAHLLEMMIARDNMEYKLRESLTSLELASELAGSAAFVFDVARNKLSGSKQLLRFWPHRGQEHVPYREWIHPADIPNWENAYHKLRNGTLEAFTVELRTDWFGKRRFYSVRGGWMKSELESPKIIGVLSDVTESREKLLNEQHLKRCLEILFNSTLRMDSKQEMLKIIAEYMEASRCQIIQMDLVNSTAQTISEYFTPEAGPLAVSRMVLRFDPEWAAIKTLLRGESVLLDDLDDENQLDMFPFMRVLRLERDWKSIFMTGIYIDGKLWGEIEIGYENTKAQPFTGSQLSFLRSAAHIVELLLIRQQSDRRLELALTEAQAAAKAKSYFLATMSHEIRTPLNAVLGFAELLKDHSVSAERRKEYLNDIATAGNALLLLINDVLDLSKLESGQMRFVREATVFPELVQEMESIFKAKLLEKKLVWLTGLKPMPILRTDKLRLRQILFNLVGNAVKFTERGTVTVSGEFLPGPDNSGTLRFAVADTGCGISQSDHERIFQPFVQSENQRGTRLGNSGTGLGLAIIHHMLEQMNGKITVDSSLGKGSVFSVEIHDVPFQQKPDGITTGRETLPNVAPVDPALRILLVDDVPMNLKVIVAMCGKLGLNHVETAGDGETALNKLREHPFDVVLTDIWMPGMNGAELAGKIRADKALGAIRIFAVTADIEAEGSFDLKLFDGVLMKPITMEKLAASIRA